MNLTDQQKEIIAHGIEGGCIKAFAGTGKTSTLVALCEAYPDMKFLYLAYNTAVREEAEKRFPENTRVETTHSIANKTVGYIYKKIDRFTPNLRMPHIKEHTGYNWLFNYFVLGAIKKFCTTRDSEINETHLPPMPRGSDKAPKKGLAYAAITVAREIWSEIEDNSTSKLQKIDHDCYLKLAQLNGSLEHQIKQYDLVLVDEAQDLNPVALDILKGVKTLAVGDPHQAIYAWRGAENALDEFGGKQFLLSDSFRFGATTADLATHLLWRFGGEKDTLNGRGFKTQLIDPPVENGLRSWLQYTFISRTNSQLIYLAADDIKKGIPIHFVGGFKSELKNSCLGCWGIMRDIPDLAERHPVTKDFLVSAKERGERPSILDLREYAEESNDNEIKFGIKVCEGHNVPELFAQIAKHQKQTQGGKIAQKLYATAHRSKGLEYDHVVLCDDFNTFDDNNDGGENPLQETGDQEVNLLYVALTRGIRSVTINEALRKFISVEEIEGVLDIQRCRTDQVPETPPEGKLF